MKAIVQAEPKAAAERTEWQEFVTPVVNIFETKDGYALEAEMPGVNKDGLEITLEGNEITILGGVQRSLSPARCCSASVPRRITGVCSISTRRLIRAKSRRRWSRAC